MKFCWCTIMVKDLEKSIKFYENIVGLKVNRKFEAGPGTEIAFLGVGGTEVELIEDKSKKDVNIGKDISLGFQVENLDEMIKYVEEKGIKIESGPIKPNPNVRFFYILDPNGVKIQFVENL